jgi:hypothetical protein
MGGLLNSKHMGLICTHSGKLIPTLRGADIHIATHGNFHHCHQKSTGDSPRFYDLTYFLPKAQVNSVGHHIESMWKTLPRHCKLKVPNEAVNNCESAHNATNGSKDKAKLDYFNNMGICHRGLFFFFSSMSSLLCHQLCRQSFPRLLIGKPH